MEEKKFHPDGYCGLYCAACPHYMATQNQTDNFETKACRGCKSGLVVPWCAVCKLKTCAREKGHDFCYQCSQYPCQDWEDFKNDPQYPYHTETDDYMEIIKTNGLDTWLADMRKRWSCTSCGISFDWWTQACQKCGAQVKGYKNPLA